jgi:hypothetical protein
MIARLGVLVCALVLAGCGSSALDSFTFMQSRNEKPIERNLVPTRFKEQVLRTVPSVVEDQTGIREAYYSDPVLDPNGPVAVYWSCVRFNARNSAKEYTGPKEYVAYYYGGDLSQFVLDKSDQCRTANYKPFPELERLCPTVGKCT